MKSEDRRRKTEVPSNANYAFAGIFGLPSSTFGLFLFLSLACFSTAQKNAASQASPIHTKTITHRGHSYDLIAIDDPQQIQFFWKSPSGKRYGSLQNLRDSLATKNRSLLAAMNGGMYLKGGSPQGLYIEAGQQLAPVDSTPEAYGNFYLQPNGIFCITDSIAQVLTTADYLQQNLSPTYATQSGPMLVINNELHPVFREGSPNVHFRNGVGVTNEGKVILAISNEEINLFDFAQLFKEGLDCPNALYLDGFVSRAYIPDLDRIDLDGDFGVMIGVVLDAGS